MSTDSRIGSLSSILAAGPNKRASDAQLRSVTIRSSDDTELTDGTSTGRDTAGSAKPPRRKVRSVQPDATAEVHRRVVCRVLQDTHDQLAAYARTHNISHGAVVLQAVEKAHTDGIFTSERRTSQVGSAMFIGANAAQTKPAAARVILDVRLHQQDVDVLQRLVAEHGLRDRTELINQALRHFLVS